MDFEDFRFVTEEADGGIHLMGFSIMTDALKRQEALFYAQGRANRFFDYLSAIHKYPVEGRLSNMVEVKPKGETRTGYATMKCDAIIHRPEDLDFSKDNAKKVLQNSDEKLVRQLSHFKRALKTDDIIEKVREYWLIIEDEYELTNPFILKYSYVRHLISHPELIVPKHKEKAEKLLGKGYINPSNPKDFEDLKDVFMIIEKKSKEIIDGKI